MMRSRQRIASAMVVLGVACGCGSDESTPDPNFQPLAGAGASGTSAAAGTPAGMGAAGTAGTSAMAGTGTVAGTGAGAGSAGAGATDELVVTLADGAVQGDAVGDTRRFLKIPFAKPPVGELRWKAPVKNDPWTGTRYEQEQSQGCTQAMTQGSSASLNEDCLYLNLWTPMPAPTAAPVMVWIHGGANSAGSTADTVPTSNPPQLWFDGQHFASRHGIVLVTINYRLGPMGFFAHAALPGEGSPLGNQGLLDQRAALEWVRDNIAAFGGDPGNVTIFGESAGGTDVCYHVASPGSRGLFHRAISESGGCIVRGGLGGHAAAEAESDIAAFVAAAGCSGADELTCLRGKTPQEILDAAAAAAPEGTMMLGNTPMFGVVIDGPGGFLPEPTVDLFARGDVARVPYMLGTNTDEGKLFVFGAATPTDDATYLDLLTQRYGEHAMRVAEQYPASAFGGSYAEAFARAVGDQIIVCSSHSTMQHAASAGLPVYAYNFNVVWAVGAGLLGASHAAEISHVFGAPFMPTPESQLVGDAMNAYWAQFAETGDPNGPDAPAVWPQYGPDPNTNDLRLQLDPNWETLQDFRVDDCAMWSELYAATSPQN